MSENSKSGVGKLNYEVDDKVMDQLGTLNKGMLAKPQFWVIVLIKCVDKRENENCVSLTCTKHEIPEFHCSIKSFVKIFCLLLAVVGYLIYRRQQVKKEQQDQEVGESENLNENDVEAGGYPKQEQLQQVETGSVASAAAGDERVVEETDNKE